MTETQLVNTYSIETVTLAPQPVAVVVAVLDIADLPEFLPGAFADAAQALAAQHLGPAGPPFARYHRLGDGRFAVEAGFHALADAEPAGRVQPAVLPGGHAAVATHIGPYEGVAAAYGALAEWVRTRDCEVAGDAWEVYLSDPMTVEAAERRTDVVQPYQPVAV